MISIEKKRVRDTINFFKEEIKEHHNNAYDKLLDLKKNNCLTRTESSFVRLLIREFKTVNFATISLNEIELLKQKIGIIPKTTKRSFGGKKNTSYLKDEILNILNYKQKRTDFYPKYFQKLGIKSCVYCNSQLTVTIQEDKDSLKYKGKFEVDHYYPKSEFPYLSIALFNLYPSCASCNRIKSEQIIDFKLYANNSNTNIFKFQLDKKSKSKFLITRNIEDLKIEFKKNNDPNYNDIFHVNEIYNTQKDLAEELILKALVYNNAYRDDLKSLFNNNRINDNLIDRLILGNYTDLKDIHKRPMAKFMQDIGREVGLIK